MSLVRFFVLFILAVPATLWHPGSPADGQPDVPWILAIGEGPIRGAVGKFTKNQVLKKVIGLILTKLIDHEFVELA